MDVDCKRPGSVHDVKVFSNANVWQSLQNGNLTKTHFSLLPGFETMSNYLIGDPAYPLNMYCSITCQEIESAFGRLKARWRILTKPIDLKLDTIPLIIYAITVKQNLRVHWVKMR